MVREVFTHSRAAIEKCASARQALCVHGARHFIARREFGQFMVACHKGRAVSIMERGAFTAEGLGREGGRIAANVDGRRMELDEF